MCMPVEPTIVQPVSPFGSIEPAAERRCRARRHSRARPAFPALSPVSAAASRRKAVLRPRCPRRSRGSRRLRIGSAQLVEHRPARRCACAYWPKVKLASEGSVRAVAGELEVEPVLAVEAGRGARQHVRAVAASSRRAACSSGRHSRRCRCACNARHSPRWRRSPRRWRRRAHRATARPGPPARPPCRSATCRRPGR